MNQHERHSDAMPSPADVLWNPPPAPRRGPKPKYTLDAIAGAAMDIADAEGLDAVTMQGVAARLGTTKMALYRYVPGRAELDAVMLERALGAPSPLPGDHWRAALKAWAGDMHHRARIRPWIVELAQRPHVPGPVELTWFEAALEAMTPLPLRGGEKLDLLVLLVGHVMSLIRQSARTDVPEAELARGLAPILAERSAEYPRTAAAFADATDAGEGDAALHFGIDRILAGVAALIDERS